MPVFFIAILPMDLWAFLNQPVMQRGHKALYTFEINGEQVSLRWDLHDMNRLEYFDYREL